MPTTTFSAGAVTVIGPDGASTATWGGYTASGSGTAWIVWTDRSGPDSPPQGVREPRRPYPPGPLAGAALV